MSVSIYAPYAGVKELLEAAGLTYADLPRYRTAELLKIAAARRAAAEEATNPPAKPPTFDGPMSVRSVRMPATLETAVDNKARSNAQTLNGVVNLLLRNWVLED